MSDTTKTLCLSCKRAPLHSKFSPPNSPKRAECMLTRFWNEHADRPGEPRANAWLRVFSDEECDEMHASSVAATNYQNGDADGCAAHIEVTR